MFGGNSNWRGPVWMPMNFLFIHAIKTYGYFYEDNYKVECPTGSGIISLLLRLLTEITSRLLNIFEKNEQNERLVNGPYNWFYQREENAISFYFTNIFMEIIYGIGSKPPNRLDSACSKSVL